MRSQTQRDELGLRACLPSSRALRPHKILLPGALVTKHLHVLFLFVSHLWSMGLKVLGRQFNLLQRCHPAYGHEGSVNAPAEMRTQTAAGGSFPAGTVSSTATRTTFESRQTLVFDLRGSTGHLRACPFLGTWRAMLCGEVLVWAPTEGDLECFWQMHDSEHHLPTNRTSDPCVLWVIAVSSQCQGNTWSGQSPTTRGDGSWGGERISGNVMERGA